MIVATAHIGANVLLIVGPIVIAIALATWLGMTLYGARRPTHPERTHGSGAHRGAVQGGVIEGSPAQRSRRDEAPRH